MVPVYDKTTSLRRVTAYLTLFYTVYCRGCQSRSLIAVFELLLVGSDTLLQDTGTRQSELLLQRARRVKFKHDVYLVRGSVGA